RVAVRAPVGRDERGCAGPGLRRQGGELRPDRTRPVVALDELGLKGSLWLAGGAGDVDEELLAVRDLRGQRRSDGLEGERQVRRVGQEQLLVATLLLQPPQLRAAGVRSAERDETQDGHEGEQRGDGERAEELLRPDRQWNACDRSYQRIADEVENPAHARCLRTWSGNSRTRIGFSR